MRKTSFRVALTLAVASLSLASCGTRGAGLTELTAHLNSRGCATEGSATASAGLTGASMGGNLKWSCPGSQIPSIAPEPKPSPPV